MSEAVSSGTWGACGVGAEVWKALNGRLLGGGIAGKAGRMVRRVRTGKGVGLCEQEGPCGEAEQPLW